MKIDDLISRQAAINTVFSMCCRWNTDDPNDLNNMLMTAFQDLPSAEPEPLTDKEQRIFFAAMAREEKVCKEVDAEMTREPYEDSLVKTCHEIIRKVKGVLWTI